MDALFFAPSRDQWLDIAKAAHPDHVTHSLDYLESLARQLRQRHDVPGVKVSIHDGEIVVSHPGGIPGLEDGFERPGIMD